MALRYLMSWLIPFALAQTMPSPVFDHSVQTGLSSLAALKAASLTNVTAGSVVHRTGFATAGDGGAADYVYSTAPCSLNAGAGDNGSQVKPNAGPGCWVADFTGKPLTPMLWGAAGDGSTNDTVAVQAALANGGAISLGQHVYAIGAPGLTCGKLTHLAGMQGNQTPPYGTASGFRPLAPNLTLLTLAPGCTGSILEKFSIDDGAAGANTSGAAIAMAGTANNITLSNVAINAPCLGLDLNGNTVVVDRLQITQVSGAACGGIRVGHATTGGATVDPRITNSTVQSTQVAPAGYDVRVEDAGGLIENNNDNLFATVGMQILPGANQAVYWATLGSSYYGDTNASHSVTIDTAAASALVRGLTMNGGWISNVQAGDGLTVNNTAGGTVAGIHLLGTRVYSNNGNGVRVGAGVTYFTVDSSHFCGNATGSSAILIDATVSHFAIRDSTLGNSCDGFPTGNAASVSLAGSNASAVITGNDMYGSGVPIGGSPTGDSVVANNTIADTENLTIPTAASITLSSGFAHYVLTGTVGVSTMNGGWDYRVVNLLTTSAVAFATGGNICNAYTSAPNVPFYTTYTPPTNCWYMHP